MFMVVRQFFLDVEALRRLDVFQVDAAESGLEHLAGANDLVGVLGGQLDIEHIDIGEAFEQHALAFHDRLAGQRRRYCPVRARRCRW